MYVARLADEEGWVKINLESGIFLLLQIDPLDVWVRLFRTGNTENPMKATICQARQGITVQLMNSNSRKIQYIV